MCDTNNTVYLNLYETKTTHCIYICMWDTNNTVYLNLYVRHKQHSVSKLVCETQTTHCIYICMWDTDNRVILNFYVRHKQRTVSTFVCETQTTQYLNLYVRQTTQCILICMCDTTNALYLHLYVRHKQHSVSKTFFIMIAFFNNFMYEFCISIHLLHSSTFFELCCAHLQEEYCISTTSGIVTVFGWLFSTQVTKRVLS